MSGLQVQKLEVPLTGGAGLRVDALSVAASELLVVAGEAGSGKTLLAAALAGSIASTGEILVNGRAVRGRPSRRLRHGLVVTVRDGCRIVGCTVEEALRVAARGSHRSDAAIERFALLAQRRNVLAQFLSGGEQQVLQVACAWVTAPRVWVLDSPTVGLAAEVSTSVRELARASADDGAAVLWLDQDPAAAPRKPSARLIGGTLRQP